ncbi:MAG: isoprenylcysteine carboxylmethyltransferase family protein [Pseudomonadota bacterium]
MTKTEKRYDVVMRLPVIACNLFFLALALGSMRGIVALHPYFGGDVPFLLALASRSAILIFLAVCIGFHVSRYRPIGKYATPYPKMVALVGMLLWLLLLLTPKAAHAVQWDSLSTLLILAGAIASALVVFELGRSLSVMPEARKLVTSGLYRRIRHPLYLAEAIVVLGIFLQFRSWQGLIILVVHFYFQIRRMDYEEGILGKSFPEYAEYKERTSRLIPGVY